VQARVGKQGCAHATAASHKCFSFEAQGLGAGTCSMRQLQRKEDSIQKPLMLNPASSPIYRIPREGGL
jgi:hypothetical protein